ncbi:hypothetical protein MPH_12206 [Macrophomina phaseolina MS6]|uniref:Centromere protein Cenp-K n=1 Tax=Macrophomina phaseolina (strain MS6) TaxID=1126212 RepID=K2RCT8_MACPH|nr:hypothetical protein MPH_12206 [Macrophomina phaseolina MS6]
MDLTRSDALPAIHRYAAKLTSAQQAQREVDIPDHTAFEVQLDQTVHELQDRVGELQRALNELRTSSRQRVLHTPSSHARERLRQLRVLKDAYEHIAPAKPPLPISSSVLPALLTTSIIRQCIVEASDVVRATRAKLVTAQRDLEREEKSVQDAYAITRSLESRVAQVGFATQDRVAKPSSQFAQELLIATRKRKQRYDIDSRRLQSALENFIEEHLAASVAAEDLGGPVVGELMDIDEETLAAGFSQHGKVRPLKQGKAAVDKRQRRIDDTWGRMAAVGDEPLTEKDAAATDVKSLIEDLLQALVGESDGGEYVELTRDSAAARFLVRAKVAQLHPKDARKMRLVDFGRDLDM